MRGVIKLGSKPAKDVELPELCCDIFYSFATYFKSKLTAFTVIFRLHQCVM